VALLAFKSPEKINGTVRHSNAAKPSPERRRFVSI
jgi:hypothetical protein